MGRHSRASELRAQTGGAEGIGQGRRDRSIRALPIFATFASFALVAVMIAPPGEPSAFATSPTPRTTPQISQSLVISGDALAPLARDQFTVTLPPPPVVERVERVAPAGGVPDPGSAQAIAYGMLQARGMGDGEYGCLVALWGRESGWNVYAHNPSSGAYGIPQALPGEKMASAGADWATNASTQVAWGLSYIESRYGTPCGAWAHSEQNNWY